MPLARSLAARYRHTGESFDDLSQVASIGLLKASDRYDPCRQTAFSSFAVPTILGELRRHLRDHTWMVHVPRGCRSSPSAWGRPPTSSLTGRIDEVHSSTRGRTTPVIGRPCRSRLALPVAEPTLAGLDDIGMFLCRRS
jgi:RNA polymerase sigma factor (sigma-70 family)